MATEQWRRNLHGIHDEAFALQVATTDVSDRSAAALDRAAIVAAKMSPASAPAGAAAVAPAPHGASEVVNGFYATNPGSSAASFQVTPGSVQDINAFPGTSIWPVQHPRSAHCFALNLADWWRTP